MRFPKIHHVLGLLVAILVTGGCEKEQKIALRPEESVMKMRQDEAGQIKLIQTWYDGIKRQGPAADDTQRILKEAIRLIPHKLRLYLPTEGSTEEAQMRERNRLEVDYSLDPNLPVPPPLPWDFPNGFFAGQVGKSFFVKYTHVPRSIASLSIRFTMPNGMQRGLVDRGCDGSVNQLEAGGKRLFATLDSTGRILPVIPGRPFADDLYRYWLGRVLWQLNRMPTIWEGSPPSRPEDLE